MRLGVCTVDRTTPVASLRLSLDEIRGAVARREVDAIVAAVAGHDLTDALQQVGTAWLVVLAADPGRAAQMTAAIVAQLRRRDLPGDAILAEDLVALQTGTPVEDARLLTVELDELVGQLEGSEEDEPGLLDLATGEVLPGFLTDAATVGEEAAVDVEEDPDRWLALDRLGSRAGWRDMADFAARVPVAGLRERLEAAIEGRGAFRRFRDLVHREGLVNEWRTFSDERAMGGA